MSEIPRRVLFLDGDAAERQALEDFLRQETGYPIERVQDAAAALERLRSKGEPYDVVMVGGQPPKIAAGNRDLPDPKEVKRQRRLLLEAAEAVDGAPTLDQGLQALAKKMQISCSATFCIIYLAAREDAGENAGLIAKAAYPSARSQALHWKPHLGKRTLALTRLEAASLLDRPGPQVFSQADPIQAEMLRQVAVELNLKGELRSALIIRLEAGQRRQGLCLLGEMRAGVLSPFIASKIELVEAMASLAAMMIEKTQLYELTRQKLDKAEHAKSLLASLEQALRNIRAERQAPGLLYEIARSAAELVGCKVGCFFVNHPNLRELELQAVYGLPGSAASDLLGSRVGYGLGLVGQVAQTGEIRVEPEYDRCPAPDPLFAGFTFRSAAALPLGNQGGVDAVLFIADDSSENHFTPENLEVLYRLALQAFLVWRTSLLIGREQRMYSQVSLLHTISDYAIQSQGNLDKIQRIVLTGVTAGYALGFNRAALLLLDEVGETLVGSMGIGFMDTRQAEADWTLSQSRRQDNFNRFLQLLDAGGMQPTPLDERIKGLHLTIKKEAPDLLSEVVAHKRCMKVPLEELEHLPLAFLQAFEPETSFVIVPLLSHDEVIGLLVADNKFTRTPVTQELLDSLVTFANTGAIAIANTLMFQEIQTGQDTLRSLYKASLALISSKNPRQVLADIVAQACQFSNAGSASMLLIDEAGQVKDIVTYGIVEEVAPDKIIRPDGISVKVMHTHQPVMINDISAYPGLVNSRLAEYGKAALCLPVLLRGKCIGVMWLHYAEPRLFPGYRVDALQLYVNQAAIAYDNAFRIRRLELMRIIDERISRAAGVSEVSRQILSGAREAMQATSASLWWYDPGRGAFTLDEPFFDGDIEPASWAAIRAQGSKPGGLAYRILSTGLLSVADLETYPQGDFISEETRDLLLQIGTKSFIGACLKVGSEPLAVLYLYYDHPYGFSEDDLEALYSLVDRAALALKKEKLNDQLRWALKSAEAAARVTALGGDIQATLASIAQGAMDTVDCDAVSLFRYNEEKGVLEHPPTLLGVWNPQGAMQLDEVEPNSLVYIMLEYPERYYLVEDVAKDKYFHTRRFSREENIRSCVVVPLRASGKSVGVMFVNYRQIHPFSAEELTSIGLFADQAAVAIQNAGLYTLEQKRTRTLQALYDISRRVTGRPDMQSILDSIVEQAKRLPGAFGSEAKYSLLVLKEGSQLKYRAAYPPEYRSHLDKSQIEVDLDGQGKIGITGRVVKTGVSQLVQDVLKDDDYIPLDPSTRSQITVPIVIDNEVAGALVVEHPRPEAFDEEDQRALESLASHAGVAIHNARLYDRDLQRLKTLESMNAELERTKGLLAARAALVWMDIISDAWIHGINNNLTNIQDVLWLINQDLQEGASQGSSEIRAKLSHINVIVEEISESLIMVPLRTEDVEKSLSLNTLIRERTAQKREAYQGVEVQLSLELDDNLTVRASQQWLRQALDFVIKNAVDAMSRSSVKQLRLATRRQGIHAEILIGDSGCGIPAKVQPLLFHRRVPKVKGEKGMGMGLLVAQSIIQTYGGDIQLESTGKDGTVMKIWLPIEPEEERVYAI